MIITNHAILRCQQIGLSPEKAKSLCESGTRTKRSFKRTVYKVNKYGLDQLDIVYIYNKGYLFTVNKNKNIIVTVTKKSGHKL